MALISIIIPIYNVEEYIAKCLDSIISQTLASIEIWCINDGSTDHSAKIVSEYQKKDSRIILVNKKNGGYGSVLEYALKHIKTDYFLICDSDDWLEKDCLEKLYKEAINQKADLIIADRYEIRKKNPTQKICKSNLQYAPYKMNPYQKYKQKELQKFSFYVVSPHAKLYKTLILKGITFPKKVHYSDFLLYIYALKHAQSVVYINEFLANYYIDRPGNSLTNRNIKDYLIVWKETLKHLTKEDTYLLYRMYTQLKYIIRETSFIKKESKKEYLKEIYENLEKLQNFNIKEKKGIDTILIKLFLNKHSYKITCLSYMYICKILLIIRRIIQ